MDSENTTPIQSASSTPGPPTFGSKYKNRVSHEKPLFDGRNCFTLKIDRCNCVPPEVWRKAERFFQRRSVISLCRKVPAYIAAQVLGSICASLTLKGIFNPFMHGGVTVPAGSYSQAFSLELIITFILMFVVIAVSTDTRAVGELAGIAVGATVILNNFISAPYTGASMNPVRSLGPAVASGNFKAIWVYIVAPITGALLGAFAYSVIRQNDNPDEERTAH